MTDLQGFKKAIDNASSIIVALRDNPSQDSVAAALALSLSLTSYGKQVATVASSKPIVRDSHLVGVDKITSEVGGNNLVITFNLPEDAVDKVTSNTEGGHLNLIIAPKSGNPPIKQNDLSFAYSGAMADLVIVVGADNLTDLGSLYEKEIELFENSTLINFGQSRGNFGKITMADPSSSNSEFTTAVIQELHLPMTGDIASNLMLGIEDATHGLTSSDMTADTFEAIAVLYRSGARRIAPTNFPQAHVVSDVPLVDVEAKEGHTAETAITSEGLKIKPDLSSESSAKADWLGPKIMKGGVSTK